MSRYVYAFRLEHEGDDVFFRFPTLPEIISAVPKKAFDEMSSDVVARHAHDAVITALQAHIATREEIPAGDDPKLRADGFVILSVREGMKLELYKVFRVNCRTVAEFAREIGKPETAARRLLELHHQSRSHEIEKAVEAFGKRLTATWSVETVHRAPSRSSHSHTWSGSG
ncbi:MAG TPA: hypothetical protein VEI03_23310 [Stellaceae bacterium]|nr:hypothetical protein [Stellaceae bacterium]